MVSGIPEFPQTLPANTVVGNIRSQAGIAEAIPIDKFVDSFSPPFGVNVKNAPYNAVGDGVTDDTAAIQAAFAANNDIYIPAGTYKITSTLTVPNRHGFVIKGEYQQTILNCTAGSSTKILTFPTGLGVSGYGVVEGITFSASGSGAGNAIGISAPSSYTFSMDFRYCSFRASLRKGVVGTFLMCDFYRCDWGTLATASGTFKAVELIGTGAFESVVAFRYCEFADSNDTLAIEINYAEQVRFEGCVFEPNTTSTAVIQCVDVLGFAMEWCWGEGNGAVPLVKQGADGAHVADTRYEFNRCHLEGNASGANDVVLDVSTGSGQKSVFTNNVISGYTHIILYAGGNYNLAGSGAQNCLAHYNNKIFGGTAGFLATSDFDGGFANYQGTFTNDDAPTGYIGELQSNSTATPGTGLSTGTGLTVLAIANLPAGDWDVWGVVSYKANAATVVTTCQQGISTVGGTLGAQGTFSTFTNLGTGPAIDPALPTPVVRVKLSTATTMLLIAKAVFTTNTLSAYGDIFARRRR